MFLFWVMSITCFGAWRSPVRGKLDDLSSQHTQVRIQLPLLEEALIGAFFRLNSVEIKVKAWSLKGYNPIG